MRLQCLLGALIMALSCLAVLGQVAPTLSLCTASGTVDTLDELAVCLQDFVLREGAIPAASWNAGNGTFFPNPTQRNDLDKFIGILVSQQTAAACAAVTLPSSLQNIYDPPAVFHDAERGEDFCVLLERTTTAGRFVVGWAWMAIRPRPINDSPSPPPRPPARPPPPGPRPPSPPVGTAWAPAGRPIRRLHLGAPHPLFDVNTDLQAVALFRRLPSLARTVVVSNKHRRATTVDSLCLPGLDYPASDPSHNDNDAFNLISYALLKMESTDLGPACGAGPAGQSLAMFLQPHGKGSTSCPSSTVFASGGFSRLSTTFYGRTDTAIARIAAALTTASAAAGWTVRLPAGDTSCTLTATRNVFGRVVNGVPRKDACTANPNQTATSSTNANTRCFGMFAHVEQAEVARTSSAWPIWTSALRTLRTL